MVIDLIINLGYVNTKMLMKSILNYFIYILVLFFCKISKNDFLKDQFKVRAPKISSYIKGPPGYWAV